MLSSNMVQWCQEKKTVMNLEVIKSSSQEMAVILRSSMAKTQIRLNCY